MKGIGALWRATMLAPVIASLAVMAQVDALAAGPDLVDARLQGAWNLEVTVASYSGQKQPAQKPVGSKATDKIWFESTCPAGGPCSVRVWGPSGPDPGQAAYYQYYSNASGFEGGPPTGLQQSGATYSATIPIGGFGGRTPCGPPTGTTRPGQTLTLRVVDAKQSGAGWLATTVSGTEDLVAGWSCNGTQTTGWIAEHLSITGHPVGYVAAAVHSSELRVSSLAAALNDPRHAFRTPPLIVANLFLTALVVLFVTFPSALFNHTLSENYEEIRSALKRFDPAIAVLRKSRASIRRDLSGRRGEVAAFAAVLAIGSLINGLLDPKFGLNGSSAISYGATVTTLLFGMAISGLIAYTYRRSRGRATSWKLQALPLGLVISAACVFISRVTDFQPGYFYGLVVGLAFGTHLVKREDGHTAAVAAVVAMVLAVAAWFVWSFVSPHASRPGAGWPVILAADFLASVFVGGLVGNVVGLLPLRALQGGRLIAWNRIVWAVIFAVAVFGLIQVLLHPEQGAVHPSQAPLVTAVILFIGFGGGSLAFNRYFAWKGRPTRLVATVTRAAEPEREPAARS